MPALTETLAAFAVATRAADIDPLALTHARMVLASTVASAAMGYGIASARCIRRLELADGGTPVASLWFHGARLPLARAVRVNAVASDAAASDDSDMRSIAHIGTIASTVGLALGESTSASGQDVLAAMVLGYEVAGRIDEALTPGRMQRGFHGSFSTAFAAAVVAGRLLGLDTPRMAQALALTATSTGGMAMAADTSCAREYHAGLAASAGVQAALAAAAGFEGELQVLEHPRGFLQALGAQEVERIAEGLGQSWDIVTDMAIKLMPGAHPFHATAEAAEMAVREARFDVEDIEQVTISAGVQWTSFKGEPHPRNLVDAAHSLHYFVAAAIVDGRFGWSHMDPARMADPVIARVQDKVRFDPAPPPLPDRFPHRHGGSVTIALRDGRVLQGRCVMPRGSGARGIAWADIDAKFRHLAPHGGLGPVVEPCLDLLHRFDALESVAPLVRLLQSPRLDA